MNTNQFAFIICTNNEQYYNECVRYIQDLYVPEGYNTDIIFIQDADSMAQGYNAEMLASEARYKIYLHQDTFILDRYFLYNILKIFTLDESIGMIRLIAAGAYDELADLVRSVREALPEDTYIREIANLMEIYSLEKASSDSIFSEWWLLKDWEQIYEYYRWVRFVLLRIGYHREDERADEVRILVKEERISREAVSKISNATIGNTVEGYSYVWNTEEKY